MSVEDVLTDGTYRIRNDVYVTLNMINYVSINISMSRALWRERVCKTRNGIYDARDRCTFFSFFSPLFYIIRLTPPDIL